MIKHIIKKINKSSAIPFSSLLLIAVCITGIFAYLLDADQMINKTTIGGNRIEIVEDFAPPKM